MAKRTQLYQKGFNATKVTLVLQGAFHLTSGSDCCESTVGPWACLGVGLLAAEKCPRSESKGLSKALERCFLEGF